MNIKVVNTELTRNPVTRLTSKIVGAMLKTKALNTMLIPLECRMNMDDDNATQRFYNPT